MADLYEVITEKDQKLQFVDKQYEELKAAFLDVLDGNSTWWDIMYYTGLSEDRCKEIEELYNRLSRR